MQNEKKIRVIVCGSRSFNNYGFVADELDELLLSKFDKNDILIVSGGAKGVDSIAIEYAKKNGLPYKIFPANWKEFKKAAGPIRNNDMAQYGNMLIAFWDGKSPGTKDMLKRARLAGLSYAYVIFTTDENIQDLAP